MSVIDQSNEKTDLKKFAYEEIKDRILTCMYPPGDVLNEQLLTKELNISRTPVREALNRLDQDGLVQILSKKGTLISNITLSDITQVYQLRIEIEPFVVRIAGPYLDKQKLIFFKDLFAKEPISDQDDNIGMLKTDTDFHKYLSNNCNNKFLIEMMNKVLDENMRIMIYTKNKVRIEDSSCEHLKIIESLINDNYSEASELMLSHIINCRDSAFNYLLNYR